MSLIGFPNSTGNRVEHRSEILFIFVHFGWKIKIIYSGELSLNSTSNDRTDQKWLANINLAMLLFHAKSRGYKDDGMDYVFYQRYSSRRKWNYFAKTFNDMQQDHRTDTGVGGWIFQSILENQCPKPEISLWKESY